MTLHAEVTSARSRNTRSFLLLCAIWGSTWIGIKVGLETVPPLFLSGSRFTVAGVLLIAIEKRKAPVQVARHDWPRIIVAAFALIALCYGLLFWGMLAVDSGTAAVIELGLTPIALLGFAVSMGDERASGRKFASLALGIVGLMVLFGPSVSAAWSATDGQATTRVIASLAIASASIVYGWGSVISRPLLHRYPPTAISGLTTLIGGMLLLVASFAIEPGATAALSGNWGARAWAGWLFLVVAGSVVGYRIYMRLLRDIGASRAGLYAFVSPVVAVLLGALLLGERVTGLKIAGMLILLAATWLAMGRDESKIDLSHEVESS